MNVVCSCAVVCFAVILLFPAPSADAAPPPGEAAAKTFLWKVEGKGGQAFLFGSLHLAGPGIYPLPRQVEQGFAVADTLVLEADPGDAVTEEVQHNLVTSALYPPPDTLRQHLSRKTYERAALEVQRLGYSIDQFARSKPWFVAMTINVLALQQLGYRPEYGLDRYFANRARDEKKIVELESFPYQIRLLNSLSDREQELYLLLAIEELKTLREETDELLRAWRTGDVETMEVLVSGARTALPETRPILEKLYYQRNRDMAARVEQLLHSGETCFIVVGAAHLVGPEGMVQVLKRKGYRVEQQ